jgi:RNA polymerase sigma factor (sigma-70 family)
VSAARKLTPRQRASLRLVTDTPRDTADRELLHQRCFDRGRVLVTFLERYREATVRFFRRRGISSPADQDDLHQELALRVWELFPFLDPSGPRPPARWLASVRRRVVGEWQRAERYRGAIEEGLRREPRETTAPPPTGMRRRLRRAVGGLTPAAQRLLGLYLQDATVREMAEATGLPPSTVHRELRATIGARLLSQLTKPKK